MDLSTLNEYAERFSMVAFVTAVVVFVIFKYISDELLKKDIGKKIQRFYKKTTKQIREIVGNQGPADNQLNDIQAHVSQNQSAVKTIHFIVGIAMTVVFHRFVTDVIFPSKQQSVVSALCVGVLLGMIAGILLSLEAGVPRDDPVNGNGASHDSNESNTSTSKDMERDQDTAVETLSRGDQLKANNLDTDDNSITLNVNGVMSLEDNDQVNNLDTDHDSGTSFQYDLLVLHKKDDKENADKLRTQLADIIPNLKIIIHDEFEKPGHYKLAECDRYFTEARYVFVYRPEAIDQDILTQCKLRIVQYESETNEDNYGRLIPVRTTENKTDMLKHIKSISYIDGKPNKNEIEKLIEAGRKSMK